MNYINKVKTLKSIIKIAIDYEFVFNFKYDEKRMNNWLKAKEETFFNLKNNCDQYILNHYYYSIIFNKKFLRSICWFIIENKFYDVISSYLNLNVVDKGLSFETKIHLTYLSLTEQLLEIEEPLMVFKNLIDKYNANKNISSSKSAVQVN